MIERLGHLKSTLPSILLLLVLAYFVHVKPSLLDEPASFGAVVVALGGILYRPKGETNGKEE